MVGKYVSHKDAYLSVVEALTHAGVANGAAVHLRGVEAEEVYDRGAESFLSDVHGIIIPGGFGYRGVEENCGGSIRQGK